jgi:hypothetical protein
MLDKLKNKLAQTRELAEKVAQENFLKNKVPEKIQQERFSICLSCPYLEPVSNRCKKCGCFMGVKTWMMNQKCPIDKWGKFESLEK